VADESETYLEAVLELEPNADAARVADWLAGRGMTAVPLAVGLLAGADLQTLASAFGVAPGEVRPGAELPVPAELRGQVASVRIAPEKQYL
jgi:hypothetical protein